MAINDKEQLRQMLIALLDTDLAHAELADRMRGKLYRIDTLLTRLPPQLREHYLIMTARHEITEALRQLDEL